MPPRPNTEARSASSFPTDPVKFFALLLAAAALVSVSCERIPPSVSIPGYAEKKAAEAKAESQPLGAAENPPAFFPNSGNAAPSASAVAKDDDDAKDDDADDKDDD